MIPQGFGGRVTITYTVPGTIVRESNRRICVRATEGNNTDPATDYSLTVTANQGPGVGLGEFVLGGAGGAILPVELRWYFRDDASPFSIANSFEIDYGFTNTGLPGGNRENNRNCDAQNGVNAYVEITIDEADLAAVPNGQYDGRFRFSYFNPFDGSSRGRNLSVRVNHRLERVRISGLPAAPVDLGTLTPGGGDVSLPLSFCVFSSTGEFEITATGVPANDGANGSFALNGVSVGNTDQLEYTVELDNVGVGGSVPLIFGDTNNGGGGFEASPIDDSCATGGPNNDLEITIPGVEIDQAQVDAYTGVLVLTVAPF